MMTLSEMYNVVDIFNKKEETANVHRVIKNNWLAYFLEKRLGFEYAEACAMLLFPDEKQSFRCVTKKYVLDSFKQLLKAMFAISIRGDKTQPKECIDFTNHIIEEFGEELVYKYFYQIVMQ